MDQRGLTQKHTRDDLLGSRCQQVGQAVHLQVEPAGLQADGAMGRGALQPDQALRGLDGGVLQVHRPPEHLHHAALKGAAAQMDRPGWLVARGEGLQGHQAPLPRHARAELQVVEIHSLGPQAHLLAGLERAAGPCHRPHLRFGSLDQQGAFHLNPAPLEHHRAVRRQPQLLQGAQGDSCRLLEIGNAVQAIGLLGRGAEHIEALAIAQIEAGGRAQHQGVHGGEAGATAEPDPPGGEPKQVRRFAQGQGLVEEGALGMGHPHDHVGAAAVVDGHTAHPLAGVELAEAVEAVGAGANAPIHPAGARLAAAAIGAIDPGVQASAHHLGAGRGGEAGEQ